MKLWPLPRASWRGPHKAAANEIGIGRRSCIVKRHKEHLVEHATVDQDVSLTAAGTTAELTAILASCNERLLEFQIQATDIVFAEVAAVQAAWLKAVTAVVEMAPQESDREKAKRLVEVVDGWFQVVTQAQTALVGLIGRSVMTGGRSLADLAHGNLPVPAERRRLAVVINFPDRRRRAAAA